jgi:hypothetical protein
VTGLWEGWGSSCGSSSCWYRNAIMRGQLGLGAIDGSRDNYYAFRKGDVPVYRRTQSVTAPEQSCKAGGTHRVWRPVEFSSNRIGT